MFQKYQELINISKKEDSLTIAEAQKFLTLTRELFRKLLINSGYNSIELKPLIKKINDAGRRTPPWKTFSTIVMGRPQNGRDGNRTQRWFLPPDHKFYADEKTATLIEVKFYFQALSMKNAPEIPNNELKDSIVWLLGHKLEPGNYLDPIQLIPIDLNQVLEDASIIQSGHLIPLDRGGHNKPNNTFFMLKISNSLQGNQTLDELLELIEEILKRHKEKQKLSGE